jgi:hypothetical protein
VRVGLAETKKFAEGYDAIFGKKTKEPQEQAAEQTAATGKTRKAGKTKVKAPRKGQTARVKARAAKGKSAAKTTRKK